MFLPSAGTVPMEFVPISFLLIVSSGDRGRSPSGGTNAFHRLDDSLGDGASGFSIG